MLMLRKEKNSRVWKGPLLKELNQRKYEFLNPSLKKCTLKHPKNKKNAQKRPQRSTTQRAKPKKIWVPKSIIKEICSQASKEKEKSKAIWIPKSHLKDLNIENTSKLTFKLPKASTPSSSKISLLPHTS